MTDCSIITQSEEDQTPGLLLIAQEVISLLTCQPLRQLGISHHIAKETDTDPVVFGKKKIA